MLEDSLQGGLDVEGGEVSLAGTSSLLQQDLGLSRQRNEFSRG